MKTKYTLLFAFLLCGFIGAQAQSLKIVYDFNKDEVKYYKTKTGSDEIKEIPYPVVGRNKMVKLEVINFNKFVYAANCGFTSKEIDDETNVNFLSMISPLVFPASGQSFFTSLGGSAPETRGGFLSTKSGSTAYEDLEASYAKLAQLESQMSNIEYVIKKLNELKYNPYLPTDTIVSLSDHLVNKIFEKNAVSQVDFVDLVVLYKDNYRSGTSQLRQATSDYLNAYENYASTRGDGDFAGKGSDKIAKEALSRLNSYTSQNSASDIAEKLNTLENLYTSIKTTSFMFNASHMAKDDEITLAVQFYENPTSAEGLPGMANMADLASLKKVKDKKFTITVKGDMKINTSIGLGFPYFADNQVFINKDSAIASQEGNNYSPNLAAYLNFYPYSGRIANVGGTFGVGVPLNDKNRSLNMFMGLSSLFGTDNRIAIHAGATLGQVSSLDQGYQVGDKLLSETQEVPTRNTWQWGAFAGISFSLSNIGNSE